jgi:hypothetical protein
MADLVLGSGDRKMNNKLIPQIFYSGFIVTVKLETDLCPIMELFYIF